MSPELHTKLGLHTGRVTADRYVGRAYSLNEVSTLFHALFSCTNAESSIFHLSLVLDRFCKCALIVYHHCYIDHWLVDLNETFQKSIGSMGLRHRSA